MKKRSTGPKLALILRLVKKNQPGLNSLSFFRAHEKEVHSDPNSLSHFKAHEKRSTGPNSHSHFKDREKEVRPDPNSLSHFKDREKKTRWGLKKRSARTSFLIFVYERHQSHYASAFDSCCYFTLVFS